MIYYKYPRTPHLPFSEGVSSDDKRLESDTHFLCMDKVLVTIKMDGENTTVYSNGTCHARSVDSKHQDYHSWLMNYVAQWYYKIPSDKFRICGEYLYARHSIPYDNLKNYFQVFGVWEYDICMPWSVTRNIINNIGLDTVPVIYEGKYDTDKIKELARQVITEGHEGIVVRNYDEFLLKDFSDNVAKFVRPGHVQTDKHWSQQKIIPNVLSKDSKFYNGGLL